MDKKKILIIVCLGLLVVATGVLIFSIVNKPEKEEFSIDGIDLPKNEEILKDADVGQAKITNVSLLTSDGISTFKARVYNNTSENLNIKKLTVVFHDGDEENRVDALKDAIIGTGKFVYINITSEKDLSNVDKIEYVLE